jgi:hypothetical protein
MSGPPLSGSSPAQAAGSSVAGSSRPQALIQRRQRLTDKLRLSTLVILSRPAPQPAPGDSAVALPTTTAFTWIVRAPEPSGDTPPRPIPLSTSLRARPCVPSDLVVCAGHPEPCPAATGGSGFTIEIGSDFVIGPSERHERPFECAFSEFFLIVSRPFAEGSVDARPSAPIGSRFYGAQ